MGAFTFNCRSTFTHNSFIFFPYYSLKEQPETFVLQQELWIVKE